MLACGPRRAARATPTGRPTRSARGPDDLATLIYTSGTTGDPKGVMLTHGNIASNVTTCCRPVRPSAEGDECLSFLPLSHIFERMFGHYSMFHAGVVINYAGEHRHGGGGHAGAAGPRMMASVPRLYEKIYARVLDSVRAELRASSGGSSPGPGGWARRGWSGGWPGGRSRRGSRCSAALADRLVFAKLRARTGGRIRFFISGGAPLSAEIAKFFYAAGLPILEGYGLTETSPVIAVNTFEHIRLGTVGRPIPGVEVRIAPDGEILTRGPNVMSGLLQQAGGDRRGDRRRRLVPHRRHRRCSTPTASSGSPTGRRTSSSRRAARTSRRSRSRTWPRRSKFVSNAVMLGDRRPFPIMLVVPNAEPLDGVGRAARDCPPTTSSALVALPEVQTKLEREVRTTLRDLAQFEMPKKFLLLPRDFSVEAGELTPTLKVQAAGRGGAAPGGDRGAVRASRDASVSAPRDAGHAVSVVGLPTQTPPALAISSIALGRRVWPLAHHAQSRQHHPGRLVAPSRIAAVRRAQHHAAHRARLERQPSAPEHADPGLVRDLSAAG